MKHRTFQSVGSLFAVGLAVACGSQDGSEFTDGSGNGSGNGDGGGAQQTFNGGGDDAGIGSSVLNECASTKLGAQLAPVNLVVMFDQSGSMGDGAGQSFGGFPYAGIWSCGGSDVYCSAGYFPGLEMVCAKAPFKPQDVTVSGTSVSRGGKACTAGTLPGGNPGYFCDGLGNINACKATAAYDPAKRWAPVTKAMSTFFESPASKGVAASLSFYPKQLVQDSAEFCAAASYASASTAMQPLPSPAFRADLSKHFPSGATPTGSAVQGAFQQVKAVNLPGSTAIVLVTDGEPYGCNGGQNGVAKDMSDAKAAIEQAAKDPTKPTKTYIVGIGTNLTGLNQLAASGGTGTATLVSIADPDATTASVLKALETIRGQAISCDVPMPVPPAGQTLDVNKVNVVISVAGKDQVLQYNKDCAGGSGWHYDNPAAPKLVQLCQSSCDATRGDSSGKLTIAFGCATQGGQIF